VTGHPINRRTLLADVRHGQITELQAHVARLEAETVRCGNSGESAVGLHFPPAEDVEWGRLGGSVQQLGANELDAPLPRITARTLARALERADGRSTARAIAI